MSKPLGEVLIEFHVIGNAVKVSAVDVATGTEVSIVGPANQSPDVLKAHAVRKLRYVLDKKHNG